MPTTTQTPDPGTPQRRKRKPAHKASQSQSVAEIISEVARQYGIPPAVALAMAEQESGLRFDAVGDGGTSFGIYQLHEGGELGSHSKEWAFNVRNNAETALRVVASVAHQNPGQNWGWITAHAQRPADESGYASSVNSILGGYQSSGSNDPVNYFIHRARAGATLAMDRGGGGGDAGATYSTPASLDTSKPQSVKQYLDNPDVESQYGYLAAYLKDPEVGPILAKAAKNGWGQDELLGALSKTKWWKTTSDSARNWQAQQRLDPATAHQTLIQMRQHIQQLAKSTLGAGFDADRLNSMANTAIAAGWNDAQLQRAVGAEFKFHGRNAAYKGAAGQTIDQLQQMSQQYLVPISHNTMAAWSKNILEGNNTADDFKSYLQSQAESLYPTLTHALKQGQTVLQYADPYLQMASQILEKPVADFNLFNPKWGRALNQTGPDGERKPMALADWGDYLRGLPEYRHTQQAQQQAAAFSVSLGNIFGKISTPSGAGLNASSAVQ